MMISSTFIILVVLSSLVLEYVLNISSGFLNINNLKPEIPEEFKNSLDEKTHQRAQDYLKATTRFGFLTSSIDLFFLLAFWALGGFPFLDGFVRKMGMGPLATGLMFIGVLAFAKGILALPSNIYTTFVIEEKFGFNTTTVSLYLRDLVRSVLVSCLLGIPLLAAILWFFQKTGGYAWIICWVVSTLFILLVQYIVPTWILPLFNTFTPLEDGELKQAIKDYADTIAFPIRSIFVMDGSKRSTKSNAFFTGFGRNRRIVLFDTLISRHSTAELVAVLAHEMGHFKKKHITRRLFHAILHMGILFYLMSLCLGHRPLFQAFQMDTPSVYAGLILFGLLYSPVEQILAVFLSAVSRRDEYEADRFAVETTPDRSALITALKKLSTDNLSNLAPHPLYVLLHYSHPPILDRIRAIREA